MRRWRPPWGRTSCRRGTRKGSGSWRRSCRPRRKPPGAGPAAVPRLEEVDVEETRSADEELPRRSAGIPPRALIRFLTSTGWICRRDARAVPVRITTPADGAGPGTRFAMRLSGQDPSTLARAIRTVLKNDEKG